MGRAPKGRDRDRADRRAIVDVLLARAQRGALTPTEAALLAEHVHEEQRLADDTRTAMAGTTQALARHRAAADAAIVEAEQRAERAEHTNRILHTVNEGRAYGARRVMDERDQAQRRAEQAEATIARVRALAADMRTWCSPHGIAADYAHQVEQAIEGTTIPTAPTPEPQP
ncbi:hypothetical protein [Streptomyces sp. ML-6]|uniref:hypothetical protein n=1 Tax=Streptomyces sp. ML-6 TaxID=2982693 RepID=UPI0024BFB616|nr:hypothetical protein [Streptomyces sp. ML-6]MDK0520368.1 hypothetical protein [Streptomyces sp. ML-6]